MRLRQVVWGVIAAGLLIGCLFTTHAQTQVWHNTESLFRHAVAHGPPNPTAELMLGRVHAERAEPELALGRYDRALEIAPGYAKAHHFRGRLLSSA